MAQQILARRYGRLNDLMKLSFDREANLHMVELSAQLAVAVGVREELVLKNRGDFHAFMQGKHALNRLTTVG